MQRKVDNRGMREINRAIVLDIIRHSERISRTELANRSALTKPTVSAIVEDLMRDGSVSEVGFSETALNGGRPARLLEFNGQSAAFLGIHFSARGTFVAVADARGVMRSFEEQPAVRDSPAASLQQVVPMVERALASANVPRSRVQSVGVAMHGPVEQSTGVCVVSPNLGWHDVPLRDMVTDAFRLPVVIHNEAHAAAVAEGRMGAAQGVSSFVWLYSGTGIGSGVVIDGKLFFGFRGFAGEIGHCPVTDGGRICACGRRGCLETVASGMAIARAARQAAAGSEATILKSARRPLDAEAVTAAAREGDKVARRILSEVGEHLGKGISYLLNILDPEMVVVAGDPADAGEALFEPLRASVDRHSLQPRGVRIVPSVLGTRAELIGAVLLGMDHVRCGVRTVGLPSPITGITGMLQSSMGASLRVVD
jgi:predicted NBD/HSP70 family sugar kinase